MPTTRKKICPACHYVCEQVDLYCQRCHTSLARAREIEISTPQPTYQPHPGERLIVVPPSTAHADEEYLNLFKRPVLYRAVRNAHYAPLLTARAVRYQHMGFVALTAMAIALTCALTMTVCRVAGWEVAWLPPPHLWNTLVPLCYAFTLLQIFATYTALRARDHALYLADMHQKTLAF